MADASEEARAAPEDRGESGGLGDRDPGDVGDRPVHMDVSWLVTADLSAVDALARLQLVAGRCGRSLRLHGADRHLAELVELAGLREALGVCDCAAPGR